MLLDPVANPSLGEQAFNEFYRDSFEPREHYRPLWEQMRRMGAIIPAAEWALIEAGLKQRVWALNLFLKDVLANDTYVKVAVGRDYWDAAPQRGTFQGPHGGETPEVSLAVIRQGQ